MYVPSNRRTDGIFHIQNLSKLYFDMMAKGPIDRVAKGPVNVMAKGRMLLKNNGRFLSTLSLGEPDGMVTLVGNSSYFMFYFC